MAGTRRHPSKESLLVKSLAAFDEWTKRIPSRQLTSRDDFFLEFCRGRDVVHLGACDTPFAQSKGAEGKLLHQKFKPVVKSLKGFDYDKPSIEWMQQNLGITDIVQRDLSRCDSTLQPSGDVVVCG